MALYAEHALGMRESITRRYDELAHALDEQLGLQPTDLPSATRRRSVGFAFLRFARAAYDKPQ